MEDNSKPKGESSFWDQWLSRAPSVLALASLSSLVFTVVHEWGYYSVIGSHLQALLTPSDYLISAFYWFPVFAVMALASLFGTHWLASIVFRGRRDRLRFGKPHYPLLVTCLLYSFVPVVLLLGGLPVAAALSLLPVLILIAMFGVRGRRRRRILLMIQAAVALFGIVFVFGQLDASADLKTFEPVYRLSLKEGGARHIVLLRSLDKGFVFHDPVRQGVGILKADQVTGLERPSVRPPTILQRLTCRTFGAFCWPQYAAGYEP